MIHALLDMAPIATTIASTQRPKQRLGPFLRHLEKFARQERVGADEAKGQWNPSKMECISEQSLDASNDQAAEEQGILISCTSTYHDCGFSGTRRRVQVFWGVLPWGESSSRPKDQSRGWCNPGGHAEKLAEP